VTYEDNDLKYFDHEMNTWRCSTCNFVLRSDGECTTRECAAKAELRRLGIER
jgi:hypothetical protein